RLEQCPELLVHPCLGLALEREAPGEEVAAVDADRSAAELPAVEGDVVLESTGPAGRVVWCRLGEVAGCRRQELLVLGEHAAERVVGRGPTLVLDVPLVHREAMDPAERQDLGA